MTNEEKERRQVTNGTIIAMTLDYWAVIYVCVWCGYREEDLKKRRMNVFSVWLYKQGILEV